MRFLFLLAAFCFSAAVTASAQRAGRPAVAPILTGPDSRDGQSYALPEISRFTPVALDLDADFAAKRMAGSATLDIQAAAGAQEIVLESKGLEIQAITGPG